MTTVPQTAYGPVVVEQEDGSIRIGYYDDDHWESDDQGPDLEEDEGETWRVAVVYFHEPPFLMDDTLAYVHPEALRPIDTEALLRRRNELSAQLVESTPSMRRFQSLGPSPLTAEERYRLLLELSFVNGLLADRMFEARRREGERGGSRVFISHASADKQSAVSLAVDLANEGHMPWLDEWEIRVGESIPMKITDGLDRCDVVVVLLSRTAVDSGWVEAEWTAMYWEEARDRKVRVLPVLLEACEIPRLLKTKKYADLRHEYARGLSEILDALV